MDWLRLLRRRWCEPGRLQETWLRLSRAPGRLCKGLVGRNLTGCTLYGAALLDMMLLEALRVVAQRTGELGASAHNHCGHRASGK